MNKDGKNRGKTAAWAASLLAAGSLAFSPIMVPAFAAKFNDRLIPIVTNFTPSGVDSELAKKFAAQIEKNAISTSGKLFPFTPAGIGSDHSRTMTVAARTDSSIGSNAISVRNATNGFEPGSSKSVRLRQSDYRLTAARGWKDFALPASEKIAPQIPISNLAGRSDFRLDDDSGKKPGRFNTNVKLDQARDAAPSPRGNAATGEYRLDVGGSFSISRKIDLTAGVRYNSERDRLIPAADASQDSEAVYIGTKIRF